MCGTNTACTDTSDTCVNGECLCGSTSPCLTGHYCTDGACKDPCDGVVCSSDSDTCVDGSCKCGTTDVCSGLSDTCVEGKCQCGTSPTCDSTTSDQCSYSKCQCGYYPVCDGGDVDSCVNGMCSCGSLGMSCAASQCCVDGKCENDFSLDLENDKIVLYESKRQQNKPYAEHEFCLYFNDNSNLGADICRFDRDSYKFK